MRTKNKAIKGRRNRCHALGFIIQYPVYDMQAKQVANKIMINLLDSRAASMPIESIFKITNIITVKRPRFIS